MIIANYDDVDVHFIHRCHLNSSYSSALTSEQKYSLNIQQPSECLFPKHMQTNTLTWLPCVLRTPAKKCRISVYVCVCASHAAGKERWRETWHRAAITSHQIKEVHST